MIEFILIRMFLTKEHYLRYFSYVDTEFFKQNNREIYRVLLTIKSLHEEYEAGEFSVGELATYFFTQYPVMKDDERNLYTLLFNKVDESEFDPTIATSYLEKCREKVVASRIAMTALDVSQGRGELTTVIDLIAQLEKPVETEDFSFLTGEEINADTFRKQGLRWRLECLNKSLGSLRKGDFGFIFKRPESGGTTFLASEVTYMAGQLDSPVLWLNNEEDGSKVIKRCMQSALNISHHDLESNFEECKQEYFKLTKGNIHLYDNGTITKAVVERICKQLQPGLILFDQLDKIYGFEADRYDLKMKAIYQWARELAKIYGPVMGVCQAGGTAEGKLNLTMTDIDSSHTAKQGEADWIIGIGASNDTGQEYFRQLNILKNKLDGDDDTIETLRHSRLPVKIIPVLGRYSDIMKF